MTDKKMISGSTEAVMQYLADEIGSIRDDLRKHHYRLEGQQYATQVALAGLRLADPAAHEETVGMINGIAATFLQKAESFGADNPELPAHDVRKGEAAYQTMADQMYGVLRDESSSSQSFQPVVIDGGKKGD